MNRFYKTSQAPFFRKNEKTKSHPRQDGGAQQPVSQPRSTERHPYLHLLRGQSHTTAGYTPAPSRHGFAAIAHHARAQCRLCTTAHTGYLLAIRVYVILSLPSAALTRHKGPSVALHERRCRMKTRQLTIHRISPATLASLLQRVQCLRYKSTGYFLLNEDYDWFIILYTLRERGIIHIQHRWPFAAFIRWATAQRVKWYITMPSVQRLCRMTHFAELSTAPWQHPHAPTHTIKKWRDLYHHFGQMIDKAVMEQQ